MIKKSENFKNEFYKKDENDYPNKIIIIIIVMGSIIQH